MPLMFAKQTLMLAKAPDEPNPEQEFLATTMIIKVENLLKTNNMSDIQIQSLETDAEIEAEERVRTVRNHIERGGRAAQGYHGME